MPKKRVAKIRLGTIAVTKIHFTVPNGVDEEDYLFSEDGPFWDLVSVEISKPQKEEEFKPEPEPVAPEPEPEIEDDEDDVSEEEQSNDQR